MSAPSHNNAFPMRRAVGHFYRRHMLQQAVFRSGRPMLCRNADNVFSRTPKQFINPRTLRPATS